MIPFRFTILGAGNIAGKFCDAVSLIENCVVTAAASKSPERAERFAKQNGIEHFYSSYEEMLDRKKPDCAYIAVTPNDHYRLTKMCLQRKIPVLCEKAMFQSSKEANDALELARKQNTFVMEGLWSRFLPAVNTAKSWLKGDRIGTPEILQTAIGFLAPKGDGSRYFNKELGGGVSKDITVYAYELTTYLLEQEIRNMTVNALWNETGVDVSNHIFIHFEHTIADLITSFNANMEEKMVIYGGKGKIVLPYPHYASEAFLYNEKGELLLHFTDRETINGFTYEIQEVIRCVREGRLESDIVPHKDTLACAEVFDKIEATGRERD